MFKLVSRAALAVGLAAMPALAATDFFEVTGDGAFSTHPQEGYANSGSSSMARIGKSYQDTGWMSWNAKNVAGVQSTAVGVNSSLGMSQFVAANGGALQSATLYLNIGTEQTLGSGKWAIETLRSGNTGVLQEDGEAVANSYTGPSANIAGSAQPYAFASAPAPFLMQGMLNSPGQPVSTPWITPSNSNVSAWGWSWTSGINAANAPIVKTSAVTGAQLGWDAGRQDVGGWALQYLLGYGNGQGSTTMSRANEAGQIVNNDGAGNAVFLTAANAVAGAPRPGTAASGWYAIDLSLDLANAIVSDPELKGIVFNQFLAGTSVDWNNGNVQFYTKDQNSSVAPFLVLNTVPEPATMILLAIGGLVAIRRRK